jgi:hypothetical protein
MKECIFPWAIAHHDLVPKAHLLAYRNIALLLNTFSPRYEPPEALVVVPSAHLMTGKVRQVDSAVRDSIARLLSSHVPFGLIGERYLDRLPKGTKALVYPLPWRTPKASVDRLIRFVKAGGALCTSGDGLQGTPLAVPATDGGSPLRILGKGRLIHGGEASPSPAAVAATLHFGAVGPFDIEPCDRQVHACAVATAEGGWVYVLFNTSDRPKTLTLRHGTRAVQLTVASRRPALVHFGKGGALLAVECQGGATVDGTPLWRGTGHFIVASLDGAGLVRGARQLLVMAVGEGRAELTLPAAAHKPVVQYGEFVDGKWRTLRTAARGKLVVEARGPLRSAIALVGEPAGTRAAAQALLNR